MGIPINFIMRGWGGGGRGGREGGFFKSQNINLWTIVLLPNTIFIVRFKQEWRNLYLFVCLFLSEAVTKITNHLSTTFVSSLSIVQSIRKIWFPKGASGLITKFYFQQGWELTEDEAYRAMKNLRIDLVCQTGENFHQLLVLRTSTRFLNIVVFDFLLFRLP